MAGYNREQLWKLYANLPEDLKEIMFNEKTADTIYNICAKNGVEETIAAQVVEYVGWVLLGLLPPDELKETIEKEAGIENSISKEIASEINRFVFMPVRESLNKLYQNEVVSLGKTVELEKKKEKPVLKQVKKLKRKDIYKEKIEE